jgi:type I restriction enzyme S subunit
MPNNWNTYKLDDIATVQTGPFGSQLHQKDYVKDGTPILTVEHLGNNRIVHQNLPRVNDYDKNRLKKYCIQKGDIVFSRVGSVDRRAFVTEKEDGWLFSGRCLRVRADEKNVDGSFLSYYFGQESFKDFIRRIAVGATMPSLNTSILSSIEICIPENLQEQQSIASILSAIDDKIENNLAINKTLEEMAMSLYKHWFVDFGPFQNGEFVESELGLIPKGWEVKRLEDFIHVLSKGTTPRIRDSDGLNRIIPFLKVKDINSDGEINTKNIELIPEEIHLKDLKRSILFENDLLFSIAGTIGRVSIVTENLNNSNCNQALAFIRLKEKEKFKALVYYWLKSEEVQNRIQNAVVQGVQANVSLTVLKELEFVKPMEKVITDFSNKLNPILELILKNQKENQTLTQLRDTLLPKLISGEERLKEFR